jgi:hypothetical protein
MTERIPVETTNLDRYGSPALEWRRARDKYVAALPTMAATTFLGTAGLDGRPHAAAIGALWLDGDVYFTSSPAARKARNLATNPVCTLSTRLDGIDLVLEGAAERVTDPATLREVAQRYRDGGWPAEVAGDAFTAPYSAPSAGPPPWQLYRFRIGTAFGVATAEPYGATRWRFAD